MTENEALHEAHEFAGNESQAKAKADEINSQLASGGRLGKMVPVDFGPSLGWGIMFESSLELVRGTGIL